MIANDAAEIELAERAHVLEEVKRSLWPRTWGVYETGQVTVPTLRETCDQMSSWHPDTVRDAYLLVLPAAQERADHLNEIRQRRRAKAGTL